MAIEQLAEEVVNEVANNFEEAAEATRKLNTAGVSYFVVGLGVGAAIGLYFGYKLNREKIRAEAYKDAEEEVAQLRTIYLEKTLNANQTSPEGNVVHLQGVVPTEKPPVEKMVENLGYRVQVPHRERPLPAPVPILDDLPENPGPTSKSMNAGWHIEKELASRTPENPYVIHQNEWNHSNLNYTKVVYTYYDIDDVVVDSEDEHPIPHADLVIGLDNLKFGHGSDDADVVYVRNDRLETDMQICRIHRSFEEDVLGMQGLDEGDDDDSDDDDDDDDS